MAAIEAGLGHTCAVTTAEELKCWGFNGVGQLGDGTTTKRTTPVDVTGLGSGVAAVTTGNAWSCALTTAGGLKCWGANGFGYLGDGTTTNRSTPVDVCATGATLPCTAANGNILTGVVAVSAGHDHTCAVTTAEEVKCWGWNGLAQLGDGTHTNRSTPVGVVGLEGREPEEQLAGKYAPVLYLVNQSQACDPAGDPYDPEAVEIVLGNSAVELKQRSLGSDEVIKAAPTGKDLFGKDDTYYLNLPGDPRVPRCDYENDYSALKGAYEPMAYAHIIETQAGGSPRLVLQYWFFYYFDDWNNTHEGDWEMIQLVFEAATASQALDMPPVRAGYSQHMTGQEAAWNPNEINTEGDGPNTEGDRPVVYVGKGSHANYFTPGDHLGLNPLGEGLGCDRTSSKTAGRRVSVVPVWVPGTVNDSQDPSPWLEFRGLWGEMHGPIWNGPKGPKYQADIRWTSPLAWQDSLRSSSRPVEDCSFPRSAIQHVAQGAVDRIENFFTTQVEHVQQRVDAFWNGSEVTMSLEGPSGQIIAPDTTDPAVTHEKGADYEFYEVENPEPGGWTVILEGTDLPPGGEDVTVTASFVPEAAPDADLDGAADSIDNCPSVYNPQQVDTNANGVGDACQGVGGITELTEIAALPLETPGSSGSNTGLLAGIAGAFTAVLTLGGAAWYARRRRGRHG